MINYPYRIYFDAKYKHYRNQKNQLNIKYLYFLKLSILINLMIFKCTKSTYIIYIFNFKS